jgi:hypothetical protein
MKVFTLIKFLDFDDTKYFLKEIGAPEPVQDVFILHGAEGLEVLFSRSDYHEQIVECIRNVFKIKEYHRIEVEPMQAADSGFPNKQGTMLVVVCDDDQFNMNFLKLKNKSLYDFIEACVNWKKSLVL